MSHEHSTPQPNPEPPMGVYYVILTEPYTTQNGDNPAAGGGVTHLNVRLTDSGLYMMQSIDCNGRYESAIESQFVSPSIVAAAIDRSIAIGAGNGGMSRNVAMLIVRVLRLDLYFSG